MQFQEPTNTDAGDEGMIDRRWALVVILALAFLGLPAGAAAQRPTRVASIGFLETGPLSNNLHLRKLFQERLREFGYIEGQNIAFETRAADGKTERLPGLAADLINRNVDVIVTAGTPAAIAAKRATSTIPVVMAIVSDPVGLGLIASLARPGGNVTGVADLDIELSGKQLELLKEAIPGLSRVALVLNADNPKHQEALREAEVAARALGMQLQPVGVRDPGEFTSAFSRITRERLGAVILVADSLFSGHRARLVDFAAKSHLPAIFWRKEFVQAGGLMSYGTSYPDLYGRAATYVDKILRGAKPADLPVEQPTKFELVVNMTTAKALGLTIPSSLLLRADQVIQ